MTSTAAEDALRDKVVTSCRVIGKRGMVNGTLGHVSARIPGTDRVIIKCRDQVAMEFTTEDDLVTIDLQGNLLEGREGLLPPGETPMHLAIYNARPEVGSVIHSHPDWTVVLTACDKPLIPMFGGYHPPGLQLLREGIPVYPRAVTIVTNDLGADFMRSMGDKRVCLLRGHGMTAAGRNVEEVTLTSLTVYDLARMNYLAYTIGGPHPIPAEDMEEYDERHAAAGAGRREPPDRAVRYPDWRYYVKKLLGEGPES